MSVDGFDWREDSSVVVPTHLGVACYWNTGGEVVIRQKGDWNEDGDTCIVFHPAYLEAIMQGLRGLAEEYEGSDAASADEHEAVVPKDPTGAERARRYRERRRGGAEVTAPEASNSGASGPKSLPESTTPQGDGLFDGGPAA